MSESKKLTKAQIVLELAERSGLAKNAVNAALEALSALAKREPRTQGTGGDPGPEPHQAQGEANASDEGPPGDQPVH